MPMTEGQAGGGGEGVGLAGGIDWCIRARTIWLLPIKILKNTFLGQIKLLSLEEKWNKTNQNKNMKKKGN